jgi:uncharacterized protein (TIGR03437 family)
MQISRLFITCVATLAAWQIATPAARAAAPNIQNVLNAANFQPGIASATWIAITGTNLSTSTRAWGNGDFIAGNLPTSLDGVQVAINGKPAYVYFISPGQINVLAPDDPATSSVPVQVTNSQGTSNTFPVNKQPAAPALFAYSQLGGRFAVIQAASNFGLVGPPRLIGPTVTTTTAVLGENLVLYGTGFGPVTPAQPTGQLVQAAAPTATPVTVTIGGRPATVQFAGLIGAGLYQINVAMPAVPTGDAEIVVSVNGKQSAGSVYVPVEAYGTPSGQSTPPLLGCVSGQVDSITFSTALMSYGQADTVTIGGTMLCPACNLKPPLYEEFASRLESALLRKQSVQACYDNAGNVFGVKVLHP